MPPLVVSNGLLVAVNGLIAGKPWTNVHGVRTTFTGTFVQSEIDALVAPFHALYDGIKGKLATSFTATTAIVHDLRTGVAASWEGAFADVTGTNAGNAMPPHVAVVATHRTALRGRSFRGRTYHAGYTENANESTGLFNATDASDLASKYAVLRTSLAAIADKGYAQAVISRALQVATPVITTSVDQNWDHQDRRKT